MHYICVSVFQITYFKCTFLHCIVAVIPVKCDGSVSCTNYFPLIPRHHWIWAHWLLFKRIFYFLNNQFPKKSQLWIEIHLPGLSNWVIDCITIWNQLQVNRHVSHHFVAQTSFISIVSWCSFPNFRASVRWHEFHIMGHFLFAIVIDLISKFFNWLNDSIFH